MYPHVCIKFKIYIYGEEEEQRTKVTIILLTFYTIVT